MARVKRSVIFDRQIRMLSYLLDRSSPGERAAIASLRMISADSELSESQVRLILRKLRASDLVQVEAREMPNGGTAENAYRVTPRGRAMLDACVAAREGREA